MRAAAFLPSQDLVAWLTELSGRYQVLAPRAEGGAVLFKPYDPAVALVLDRDATAPPKQAVFPATEELLRFSRTKDPDDPGTVNVVLNATRPVEEGAKPAVVFGARPCGVRGFGVYDRVYDSPTVKDPYYVARRENTLFITLACTQPGNTCFCHWVNSGPADCTGSDVLLTPVAGGYVALAVTAKGEALMDSPHFSEARERVEEARAVHAHTEDALPAAPDLGGARESLMALFDDMGFWEKVSAKCLSCGACTYLCPTCYCFTVTDEESGMAGRRLRSWDTCMSYQFTLEASGHNPRPTKAHRLKNRVGHKFSYYPELHGNAVACCGCGRCIRSCPAGVDIREIVLAAIAQAARNREEAPNA